MHGGSAVLSNDPRDGYGARESVASREWLKLSEANSKGVETGSGVIMAWFILPYLAECTACIVAQQVF